jgi:predicted  nucleic acid-binding Zn-ribbon protein
MSRLDEIFQALGVTNVDDALHQLYHLNNEKTRWELEIQELQQQRKHLHHSIPKWTRQRATSANLEPEMLEYKRQEYRERLQKVESSQIDQVPHVYSEYQAIRAEYEGLQSEMNVLTKIPPDLSLAQWELHKLKETLRKKMELRSQLIQQT